MGHKELEQRIYDLLKPYESSSRKLGTTSIAQIGEENIKRIEALFVSPTFTKTRIKRPLPPDLSEVGRPDRPVQRYRVTMAKYLDQKCGLKIDHPTDFTINLLEAIANYVERQKK